jgi:diguanylate cyclase (GGDEF)-like protein
MSERKPILTDPAPVHDVKTFILQGAGPLERSKAVLTVTSGPDAGRVLGIPRGAPVTFGRAETCTYSWPDGSLSRTHAMVVHVAGAYVIKDEGSTNGTFVNDERVQKTARLADGDRVQLGTHFTLRFSLVTQDEESSLQRLFDAAMRDGLTGVFNRKHIEERLEAELAYAHRHNTPLSVVMLDVDHFKNVNDTYGHQAGDAVLKNVAGLLVRGVRAEDVVGRFGGEEFIIVARQIGVAEAAAMSERMRAAIEVSPTVFDGKEIAVAASFGVASIACCGPATGVDGPTLVRLSDARLYEAKRTGRNRVVSG